MDCMKLSETQDIFGHAGFCISIEQSKLLQNSLIVLQKENHFQKCFYWGKIYGIQQDYHIAYGYKKECLESRKYFYSFDCLNWLLMPMITRSHILLAPLAIFDFQGDPSVVTNVYDTNPPYFMDKEMEPLNKDSTKTYLKEEDRLAATIYSIATNAAIIPRGAWIKLDDGRIIENMNFEGLDLKDAQKVKSYSLARPPQSKWNANLLTRTNFNCTYDFLDTIDECVPPECWNLQIVQAGRLALLHNLCWPGMTFFHKINTPHHGYLYVGNGKRNLDVPFML
ncbi:radial spoke head protein 9 homolog [Trichogramma pretiosum]|uniref:radial spoke head protein 9 homolog n=1 Tax=Trichogramma pretiosum TaxID=7493 RepID=UPI0006C94911|nr:radial spoke head protein 9 homolog [Trichogramma pretiosum]